MTEAVEILNAEGKGRVVILCEHASSHIPPQYDNLGLSAADSISHAAWDPGARDLSLFLSKALDAPVVASRISRLVYDCNRPPEAPGAMTEKSEVIEVPGNRGLSAEDRQERVRTVYRPFCDAAGKVLDSHGPDTVVVTVHSFTPIYFGKPRSVEIGLLHDSDSRFVDEMLDHAGALSHRRVARNEPYGPEDGVTHSLQIHALSRGLANVMIEVRNDLLSTPEDIDEIGQELLNLLLPALEKITNGETVS
ncbi:N-formylglutamate amidohydrolase [Roseibium sp. SCPC15]|uniref:N-formylglutamate amidohydrolase n=1 Tax=Roseibium sp. SCP15 TaxID=3141376 RepID=UPI00333CAF0A